MKRKYYQIVTEGTRASIDIYGDITSWKWLESDVTSFDIKKEIDALDVTDIDVYINSYGGEVAEALAIYSALKRNKAAVHTYCDGFACSAATIIFAAGETRTMGSLALLMIHNCMSYVGFANSEELRKAAEDNDKINQSSIKAYMSIVNISEDEIRKLMNEETWITSEEAVGMGFATDMAVEEEGEEAVTQSARHIMRDRLTQVAAPESDNSPVLAKLDEIINLIKQEEDPEDPDGPDDDSDDNSDDDSDNDPGDDPEEKPEEAAINTFINIFK